MGVEVVKLLEWTSAAFAEPQRVLGRDLLRAEAVGAYGHQWMVASARSGISAKGFGDRTHRRRRRLRVEYRQVLTDDVMPLRPHSIVVPVSRIGHLR